MTDHSPRTLLIFDPEGNKIIDEALDTRFSGVNLYTQTIEAHPKGYYQVLLKTNEGTYKARVLKQ